MPRFDGTGPTGQGPMSGRGMGYCAMNLPAPGANYSPYGYAGIGGVPVNTGIPRHVPPARSFGKMAFRGFGRGCGMRRGRWFRAYW